jgi:hypothetical protein
MFREPDCVVPGLVHDLDTLKGAFVDGRQWLPSFGPAKELQDSKFHQTPSTRLTLGASGVDFYGFGGAD